MLVHDLDHCSDLTHSGNIGGGLVTDNTLLLSIIDRQLLLSFGGNPLFETTLSEAPSGIRISLENVSGIPINVIATSTGGGVSSISVFAGQSVSGSGTASAITSSAAILT
jgi:hypothetical protein